MVTSYTSAPWRGGICSSPSIECFHDQLPKKVLAYLTPTEHLPPLRCHLLEVSLILLVDLISKSRPVSFDFLLQCAVLHRSLSLLCFHLFLVSMNSWLLHHCLQTLASWCSLRLIQVCANLAARTMCKGRNDPRNHPRNDAMGVRRMFAGSQLTQL